MNLSIQELLLLLFSLVKTKLKAFFLSVIVPEVKKEVVSFISPNKDSDMNFLQYMQLLQILTQTIPGIVAAIHPNNTAEQTKVNTASAIVNGMSQAFMVANAGDMATQAAQGTSNLVQQVVATTPTGETHVDGH